ncbi:MAG: acetyl-CoA carboxylase biotin carboxyl carrier protein subunit [Kiloniellales bacterium]|nr:acetyl-CoA carboxylase biotin carboxyl carrier protein subunit [Kiloniellales bacterium]MDJ0982436.1 acetyl-CoA carboxylase biotin carboxyl carrier protein subunit [Kiloniellales bacterium]
MQRRFKISVEGRDYDVVVEEVTEDSGGLYPDRDTMRAAPVQTSRPAAGVTAPTAATANPRPTAGAGDVVSPLAGVVVSIDVEAGAQVEAETRVATLEAMKTKTMVKAGRSGKVSAIAVGAGEAVEAGQTLLTID